jgi:hypothetical protein
VNAQEGPQNIRWYEFRNAFCTHHAPQGVIKLKRKEFHDLKLGSMSVNEYVTLFTQLSCYAPTNVETDEKKQDVSSTDLTMVWPMHWRLETMRISRTW